MELKKYLLTHQIIKIGIGNTDIIVDEPIDFILSLPEMEFQIVEILWWERLKVNKSSDSIGYGGPLDPRDNEYYFSETDYYRTFDINDSVESIEDYIMVFQCQNKGVSLYPSFSLEKTVL